jgi:hypothetical protein
LFREKSTVGWWLISQANKALMGNKTRTNLAARSEAQAPQG